MNYAYPLLAFTTVAVIAAGCGSSVVGGNVGGAGGEDPTTTATTTTSTTSTTSTTTTTSTTSTTSRSSTSSSSSSGTGGTSAGAQPPPPGSMAAPDGSAPAVFAIRKLFMGDTNRDGTPNAANAWKQYGYDIDGRTSTATATDLCKPRQNALPKYVYQDGNDGIDNSFGRNILPIFLGLESDFSYRVNQAIATGQTTTLLDLESLGESADYNPLVGRVYQGGDLGQPPQWMGNDAWPVASGSLAMPPSLASAKLQTAQSYVVGNTWVARLQGDLTLKLEANSFPLPLVIHNPIITMQLDAAHQSADNGTIAGVIATDALLAAVKQVAGNFDPSLCEGPTIDSILAQLEQASDILVDASQDPTKVCDGISIGLGFNAQRVTFGPVQASPPPPPDPCVP